MRVTMAGPLRTRVDRSERYQDPHDVERGGPLRPTPARVSGRPDGSDSAAAEVVDHPKLEADGFEELCQLGGRWPARRHARGLSARSTPTPQPVECGMARLRHNSGSHLVVPLGANATRGPPAR
jgi:hypothetical protein